MSSFHIDLWLLYYTHNALVIPDDDNNVTEVWVSQMMKSCVLMQIIINKHFHKRPQVCRTQIQNCPPNSGIM